MLANMYVLVDARVALSIKTIARRLGLNATEQAVAITKLYISENYIT